ncbi:MAG: hypothetical protein L7F78_18785 [Syntrophales bacterium LBB04]|nr:hypothetical protein [Syntrophales bacterium LBB04]
MPELNYPILKKTCKAFVFERRSHMSMYFKTPIFSFFLLFTLASCGGSNSGTATTKSNVPDGAPWSSQHIFYSSAPDGFGAVLVWAQAATLYQTMQDNETAVITIDYMRLVQKDATTGTEIVVYEETYDNKSGQLSLNDGGLYLRNPSWFPPGDYHTPITNSEIKDGVLIFDVKQTPDKIIHWWSPRITVKSNQQYFGEMRLKIQGAAAVQLGADYWRDLSVGYNKYDSTCKTSNNCEAWVSNWIGDTNGAFVIVRSPQ